MRPSPTSSPTRPASPPRSIRRSARCSSSSTPTWLHKESDERERVTSDRFDRTPVDDRALRHSVTDYVLDAVRAGRLGPGDRVHETSLAKALDVSLSPVCESLFRLADQGWLEHRPRRGFYVRTFTPAETQEIFTFRALLERFAARTVTERWAGGIPEEDLFLKEEMECHVVEGERLGRAGD